MKVFAYEVSMSRQDQPVFGVGAGLRLFRAAGASSRFGMVRAPPQSAAWRTVRRFVRDARAATASGATVQPWDVSKNPAVLGPAGVAFDGGSGTEVVYQRKKNTIHAACRDERPNSSKTKLDGNASLSGKPRAAKLSSGWGTDALDTFERL